ncbi:MULTISPECIES: winged helix-turn-helix domain-containing protein [Bacillota]|nr:response regulator transcription factor [Enterococcus casseliflavus]
MEISEPGDKIGEKLLMLLDARQRQELVNYLLGKENQNGDLADNLGIRSGAYELLTENAGIFTEIHMGDLYFCLEQRLVRVDGQVVNLTAKEFDILALLITHPQRVFTYELIMELVWNEDVTFYSRKAVSNHMSNLRKKLKITPDGLEYIKNIVGVGYKFEIP